MLTFSYNKFNVNILLQQIQNYSKHTKISFGNYNILNESKRTFNTILFFLNSCITNPTQNHYQIKKNHIIWP